MSAPGVALVLGATGVTGTPFSEQLLIAGWRVYGISRRPPLLKSAAPLRDFVHRSVDLHDGATLQAVLRAHSDITHIFDCANIGAGTAQLRPMRNLLDAIEANVPRLRNINLLQGMKYYGCHLGPFRTPAREDDPRVAGNNFYYEVEDLIRRRQGGKSWTWTALRPHSVCGYAPGNPLNLALVLAIYASIRRELGEPLWFPANRRCFESWFQVIDADLLARAAIHVATNRACASNIYNVNNGEFFHWRDLWPAFAAYFDVKAEGPGDEPLADFLSRHRDTWHSIAARHGLRPFPIERAAAWVRGDYTAPNSRFAAEYDIIADTTKFRRTGFPETIGNEAMFLRLFKQYRVDRLIP